MSDEDLKIRIMRRIYITNMLRKTFAPFMLRVYIGIVVIWQLVLSVSLSNVFENLPGISHPFALYNFASSAFMNTEMWVKILSVCLFLVVLWLSKDFMSNTWGASSRHRILEAKN